MTANTESVTVVTFHMHRDWFVIDETYQREEVWTKADKQCFIDSILRGYDIPKIYLWVVKDTEQEIEYKIVDGQQRIRSIWQFYDNRLCLNSEFSERLGGKTYRQLPPRVRVDFDTRNLSVCYLRGYSDGGVRALFRRLQRGKALTISEKLNAFPGDITLLMRKLAKHNFFSKSTTLSGRRYRYFKVVASLLLLEEEGLADIKPTDLEDFFDKNRRLTEISPAARQVNQNLNYLFRSFPRKVGELNSEVWIITIYLLVAHCRRKYAVEGREKTITDFYIRFWRKATRTYQALTAASRGKPEVAWRIKKESPGLVEFALLLTGSPDATTNQKNIKRRVEIILESFIESHRDLPIKDPKRVLDYYEKVVLFRRKMIKRDVAKCEECGKQVTWNDYEADHVLAWSKGGSTTLENAQVLCRSCNRKKRNKIE